MPKAKAKEIRFDRDIKYKSLTPASPLSNALCEIPAKAQREINLKNKKEVYMHGEKHACRTNLQRIWGEKKNVKSA